jgi:hypothetical protein
MVISRNQIAGKIYNKGLKIFPLKEKKKFKYLETTLRDQNSIQEKTKSRLKSGIVCYNSVQNLLSSSVLHKNRKIKTYRNIILPFFCMGVYLGRSH